MTINYPKGSKLQALTSFDDKNFKKKSYANRGMSFEEEINQSNLYYLTKEKAVIHKKPTPIQIVKVHYPKRSAAMITEAYFKESSTTDYNGIYRGRYIDFEAKETKNKTSFPLNNFHEHQISHMKLCLKQGGIIFILIRFSSLQEIFYLPAEVVIDFWDNQENGKRKSIPYQTIKERGFLIETSLFPQIPYLEVIDKFILKGDSEL
ncbi:Holliday junction resolvase RecU [Vagococcus sp.]|uniref:Holliday junction resolvase RecU n=1 Tax=Vagococcus sp. TaxID=1933889 RepID=UPI003F9CA226